VSQENAEIVRLAYEHLNRGDVEGLIELCEHDFLMDMSERVFNPDTYNGADGIRRFYEGVRDAWESYHWEVEETHIVDDSVVAMLHCQGQGREGGPQVDWRVAWVWRFRGGRPVSLRFYRDRAQALKAAGVLGRGGDSGCSAGINRDPGEHATPGQ
jgi:ketosteroid isomerase-like protein